MAEVYPSDNQLLNIQSDSQTGVEYIPTGSSPYYVQFRRLLYRLLLATVRANDLRVYDEGGLEIGVKSGAFWSNCELKSFAGASGVELSDDKEHIYIYLDSDGELVVDEYSGFPDMKAVPHIRLAVAETSGGDIQSIVDARMGHNFVLPFGSGGAKKEIEVHTSDDTLTVAESGSVHTNRGATGTITLTLPASAQAGTNFVFAVQESQQLRVKPGAATIRDTSGQTQGKYKTASGIGESITVAADSNGDWVVIAKNGNWTEEQ
jgi:hypothetical protein